MCLRRGVLILASWPRGVGAPGAAAHTEVTRMDDRTIQRFWAKVNKDGPVPSHAPNLEPCWIWTGSRRAGYGLSTLYRMRGSAHRIAYSLAYGQIPAGRGYHGTCVLHRCDNKLCVNPAHLLLGTQKANMADASAKGRLPGGYHRRSSPIQPVTRVLGPSHRPTMPEIRAWLAKKRGD